jgi:hypothetical protein
MPAVRLQKFQASLIVEFFASQGVADVLADVIVADTPGIRIAVRPLPDLRRRPRANPGKTLQSSIRLLVGPGQGPLQRSGSAGGPDQGAAAPLFNS